MGMTFGRPSSDLLPGARNAVNTCLAVRRGERVALVADEASRDVAASLERELQEAGADSRGVLIESVAARPMTSAPDAVLRAFDDADAGILRSDDHDALR